MCSQIITDLSLFQSLYLFLVSKQAETNGNTLLIRKVHQALEELLTERFKAVTGSYHGQQQTSTETLGRDLEQRIGICFAQPEDIQIKGHSHCQQGHHCIFKDK